MSLCRVVQTLLQLDQAWDSKEGLIEWGIEVFTNYDKRKNIYVKYIKATEDLLKPNMKTPNQFKDKLLVKNWTSKKGTNWLRMAHGCLSRPHTMC